MRPNSCYNTPPLASPSVEDVATPVSDTFSFSNKSLASTASSVDDDKGFFKRLSGVFKLPRKEKRPENEPVPPSPRLGRSFLLKTKPSPKPAPAPVFAPPQRHSVYVTPNHDAGDSHETLALLKATSNSSHSTLKRRSSLPKASRAGVDEPTAQIVRATLVRRVSPAEVRRIGPGPAAKSKNALQEVDASDGLYASKGVNAAAAYAHAHAHASNTTPTRTSSVKRPSPASASPAAKPTPPSLTISPTRRSLRPASISPTHARTSVATASLVRASTVSTSIVATASLLATTDIIKLKIFLDTSDAMALLVRKDRLRNLNELVNLIIFRLLARKNDLNINKVKLLIFFKDNTLNPIVLKQSVFESTVQRQSMKYYPVIDDNNDSLLFDYVMMKKKLYIKAEM